MRVFAFVVVVVLSVGASRPAAHAENKRQAKRMAATTSASKPAVRPRDRSLGAPWEGKLLGPARLEGGEGYHLRRPWRTYATRTTVELVRRAIGDTREAFPKAHVLAIGDLSAEAGGRITEHASHQSGRDVDLGLFYKRQPQGYPAGFVRATAATLDVAATWSLISNLARTADEDGGVQLIFLDQRLQHVLYRWAEKRGLSAKRIKRVQRVLRHAPNHDDHLHVRFKCRARDTACR